MDSLYDLKVFNFSSNESVRWAQGISYRCTFSPAIRELPLISVITFVSLSPSFKVTEEGPSQ